MTYIGSVFVILESLVLTAPAVVGDLPDPGNPGHTIESDNVAGYFVVAIPVVIGAALIVLVAFAQRGRNGARVALTILSVIDLAESIPTDGPGPAFLVQTAYVVVMLALFWVPRSSGWYRNAVTHRRGRTVGGKAR